MARCFGGKGCTSWLLATLCCITLGDLSKQLAETVPINFQCARVKTWYTSTNDMVPVISGYITIASGAPHPNLSGFLIPYYNNPKYHTVGDASHYIPFMSHHLPWFIPFFPHSYSQILDLHNPGNDGCRSSFDSIWTRQGTSSCLMICLQRNTVHYIFIQATNGI